MRQDGFMQSSEAGDLGYSWPWGMYGGLWLCALADMGGNRSPEDMGNTVLEIVRLLGLPDMAPKYPQKTPLLEVLGE
ncbi:hypothetical protein AVEN_246520-1 [Araneus ventricosus]|uniref:Uncharacterized protein n=1 Tax=Araneus ventricosus TaxID=182803 RepID=A0A4Y2LVA4_ARAVE|nr:hypothetical protein AVEN_246520-1 [Araneus ventricosus]